MIKAAKLAVFDYSIMQISQKNSGPNYSTS